MFIVFVNKTVGFPAFPPSLVLIQGMLDVGYSVRSSINADLLL